MRRDPMYVEHINLGTGIKLNTGHSHLNRCTI